LRGTLCEMLCQRLYNWINCRLYLSKVQSMFHVQLKQRWHAVSFDSLLSPYHTSTPELLCMSSANPSSILRPLPDTSWPLMSSHKSKQNKNIDFFIIILLLLFCCSFHILCFHNTLIHSNLKLKQREFCSLKINIFR
jgi:hypothetical protein